MKPTLNAAVSDGLLSIQAHDTDSGIKAIYVNGYEFTDHTNGALNIRLQQFDAGFSISRFQPWIMQEIPQKSIKQPIRITPIRKTRTAMKKIRHSSSRWMRQQPSLALQPHRLQTIPRQTAMEILFPNRQWNNFKQYRNISQAVPEYGRYF